MNTKLSEVKNLISDTYEISKGNLIFTLIKSHDILEIPDENIDASYIDDHEGVLFLF